MMYNIKLTHYGDLGRTCCMFLETYCNNIGTIAVYGLRFRDDLLTHMLATVVCSMCYDKFCRTAKLDNIDAHIYGMLILLSKRYPLMPVYFN